MATNLYIIDFMMWEEYIRQWANKKIEIPELRLSESLKAELVKTLLLVFPRPYEEHTYEEAAEITNNQPCLRTIFFEDRLLNVDTPLLLSLDNLEEVFTDPLVGTDVCNLLRSWKEQRGTPWRNMRMVILHTGHINDGINNSSLQNVGSLITLPELTIEQVTKLVELYNLTWDDRQIESLVDLVGGDPSLIRLVLDRIAKGRTSLEDVLAGGHLPDGLFQQHLARQWRFLKDSTDLCKIVRKVLREENPEIPIDSFLEQLRECGIIKADGTRTILTNRLYKLFLVRQLPVDKT
jgi:hypothetical protein